MNIELVKNDIKKEFKLPEIEIVEFDSDIITTSGTPHKVDLTYTAHSTEDYQTPITGVHY